MGEDLAKAPDLRPLTVEHGRKLLAQSVAISEQISRLMPLLALLEVPSAGEETDPIQTIVRLLEALSVQGQDLAEAVQEIEDKMDRLIANANIAMR